MNAFQRAQKLAQRAQNEREIQKPDYEWLGIRHTQKMQVRGLKKLAQSLDSLYTNLNGGSQWR